MKTGIPANSAVFTVHHAVPPKRTDKKKNANANTNLQEFNKKMLGLGCSHLASSFATFALC